MHAHLDPFCGASGDMLLGALVDAGVPLTALQEHVDALGLDGLRLEAAKVVRRGIAATHVRVTAPHEHHHRHLPDIERIIGASNLPAAVKTRARAVFRVLAEAEAAVHDLPVDAVHFHEVGALDAIADVVGVVSGFHLLGVETLSCRALPVSHGTVLCEHGVLPVPAPAVLRLMDGLPTVPLDLEGETVTPTAAALARSLVTDWSGGPAVRQSGHGYGAGSREFPRANVLRLVLGTPLAAQDVEQLALLETNVDDMNPEWLPAVIDRLLAAGALDVWLTPILMKKGRPGQLLSVLAEPAAVSTLRDAVYGHTTSLGIRETRIDRHRLPRETARVQTDWGPVRIKVATLPDGDRRASPEYDDCRQLSDATGVPLQRLYEAALAAWQASKSV